MDGGFLSSKRSVSSMVALLIAASAAIVFFTHNRHTYGTWTVSSGETGEPEIDYDEDDEDEEDGFEARSRADGAEGLSGRKRKRRGRKAGKAGDPAMTEQAIDKMLEELRERRALILKTFEESRHSEIPAEMRETMEHIDTLDPSKHPSQIRLMCSQLIQDYAIMQTSINEGEPDAAIIEFAKEWLDFDAESTAMRVEQINHRYALALRSRSMKEFTLLHSWLQKLSSEEISRESIHENWVLRNFQCACLLGDWSSVVRYGRMLEGINPEKLAAQSGQQGSSTPLHPLHLFEYIALKLPNQSANFTQAYYNSEKYKVQFDTKVMPPLRFTEWSISDCTTRLIEGFSTNPSRDSELQSSISGITKATRVAGYAKCMFVYGCLVQFPCYWVQLPTARDRMQPVVLCGPWNDCEMEMTASYVRRMKDGESDGLGGTVSSMSSDEKKDDDDDEKDGGRKIMAVRSDLRLTLSRFGAATGPTLADSSGESSSGGGSGSGKKAGSVGKDGWVWRGLFDHEEGTIQVSEKDLTDFAFRRDHSWKERATQVTVRTWEIEMIVCTPD